MVYVLHSLVMVYVLDFASSTPQRGGSNKNQETVTLRNLTSLTFLYCNQDCRRAHMNEMVLKQHLVESPVTSIHCTWRPVTTKNSNFNFWLVQPSDEFQRRSQFHAPGPLRHSVKWPEPLSLLYRVQKRRRMQHKRAASSSGDNLIPADMILGSENRLHSSLLLYDKACEWNKISFHTDSSSRFEVQWKLSFTFLKALVVQPYPEKLDVVQVKLQRG